jgi:hypothetical protein
LCLYRNYRIGNYLQKNKNSIIWKTIIKEKQKIQQKYNDGAVILMTKLSILLNVATKSLQKSVHFTQVRGLHVTAWGKSAFYRPAGLPSAARARVLSTPFNNRNPIITLLTSKVPNSYICRNSYNTNIIVINWYSTIAIKNQQTFLSINEFSRCQHSADSNKVFIWKV